MVLWFRFFSNNWNQGKWIQITTQHWFRLVWGGYLKKFRIQHNHRVWVFWEKKKTQIQTTVSFRYLKNVYEPPSFMKGPPTNDLVVLGRCLIFFKRIENCDHIQWMGIWFLITMIINFYTQLDTQMGSVQFLIPTTLCLRHVKYAQLISKMANKKEWLLLVGQPKWWDLNNLTSFDPTFHVHGWGWRNN